MPRCDHPFDSLFPSITGLVCRECGEKITPEYAPTLLLSAVREKLGALDERIEKAESALGDLGFLPCERCGAWLAPNARQRLHAKVDGGDLVLCAACVARCLDDENDERLYDPKLDRWFPGVPEALCRFSYRLHPEVGGLDSFAVESLKRQIRTTFPAAWKKFCASLP